MKPFVRPATDTDPQIIFACAHWRSFPPPFASAGMTPEELRLKGHIQEVDYQRMLVWKRVCGLTEMLPDKCMKCPHIRIAEIKNHLPVLTTLDRTHSVPAVDLPTVEMYARRTTKVHLRVRPPPGIVGKVPGGVKGGS